MSRRMPRLVCAILLAITFLVSAALVGGPAFAMEREDGTNSGRLIADAIFADGLLWVLWSDGQISTIREGGQHQVSVTSDSGIQALVRRGEKVVIFECDGTPCTNWNQRVWTGTDWQTEQVIATQGDMLKKAGAGGDAVVLLTDKRIIELREGQERSFLRPESRTFGRDMVMLVANGQVFVGHEAGEWGGGLERIDLTTGAATVIAQNDSGAICGGPLTADCDPVTGLALAPWRGECVVATIGLLHLSSHGRIVEICGDAVRRIYVRAFEEQAPNLVDEPYPSVAFWSLAAKDGFLLAAGIDALYQIGAKGEVSIAAYPKSQGFDGLNVSFERPDMVLIGPRTEFNFTQIVPR